MSWNRTLTLTLDIDAPYGRVLIGSLTDTALLNQPPVHILGDAFPIRLQFARRSTIPTDPAIGIALPAGSTLVYSAKAASGTGDLLFLADDFAPVLDEDDEPIPGLYQGNLNLNTTELAAHIAAAPTGPKTILGEVEIRNASNTERISLQFDLLARPQIYIGTEGVPTDATPPYPLPGEISLVGHTHIAADISDSTSAGRALLTAANPAAQRTALELPPATESEMRAGTETGLRAMSPLRVAQAVGGFFRMGITGLTGGGSTNLDGVATVGVTPPYLIGIVVSGSLRFYLLQTGTDAEASPGIIRPDDYSPATNEKVWTQVL